MPSLETLPTVCDNGLRTDQRPEGQGASNHWRAAFEGDPAERWAFKHNAAFAMACHRATGWPIWAIADLEGAAKLLCVIAPGGEFVDVAGPARLSEIAERFPVGGVSARYLDPVILREMGWYIEAQVGEALEFLASLEGHPAHAAARRFVSTLR